MSPIEVSSDPINPQTRPCRGRWERLRFENISPSCQTSPGIHYGGSFDMMIVPLAANMSPTSWQTDILAPGIRAGAVPRIWRTLSLAPYALS